MRKRLITAFVFLILFSTYRPHKLILNEKFNIEIITVDNNQKLKEKDIKKKLSFLYKTNLIFLDTPSIKMALEELFFIESFKIKKIYPNKLKIKIYEKKPILILQRKKKKFYLNENIDLIDYLDLENYRNLPVVFGNEKNFKIFYQDLKKINFPINLIENYHLFESNRWDLITYNKKTIKLPSQNYIKSLKNFQTLIKENHFDKYKIFDYRLDNQLILK